MPIIIDNIPNPISVSPSIRKISHWKYSFSL